MQNFSGKIAVITGAASGIGEAMAWHCAREKMCLVLADIDATALHKLENALKQQKVDVIAMLTDVGQEKDLHKLAKETQAQFGVPCLLVNNAGVGGPVAPLWELSAAKLRWVMDINFMGVVHGIQAFIPAMLNSQEQCHIVNTASMAGFYTFPYLTSYQVSKHGVVALSEALHHDLKMRGKQHIKVSVLCPGGVQTRILDNNVREAQVSTADYTAADARWLSRFAKSVKRGLPAEEVAKAVFTGIAAGKFYIFTHPELKENIKKRMDAILQERNPTMLEM